VTPPRKPLVPVSGVARELAVLRPRLLAAVDRVLASGRVVRGPSIERFEREWAAFTGVRSVVLAHSGTSALAAALAATGVGARDEVLVPALTFPGTAEAVLAVGAAPIAVDVDPDTLLLDAPAALRAVGPRTRAVVPVHLYGQVHAGLRDLARALRSRGAALVEDACQAHGAFAPGVRPGRWSAAAAYSFYPTKNLGTVGEAGAIATDDEETAGRLRALRDHGSSGRGIHAGFGVNLWPGQLEAAILSVKLPRLRAWNEARRRMALRYDGVLQGCSAVRPVANAAGEGHVYHQYVVRCPARDELRRLLLAAGIETAIYYPRTLLELPGLAGRIRRRGACPHAEAAAREVLSLPVHPWLSAGERARCIQALGDAARSLERSGSRLR
jgi:dTDP-4-amino-4,6-dideoxygalactose transaminase